MPYLKTAVEILVHYNIVNNNYNIIQVLYIFVPKNVYGHLLDIS